MLSVTHSSYTPRERAWHATLKARMNAIYYERLIADCERLDRWLRLGSILLSSGGVVAALKWADSQALAMALGIVAALLSGVTLVWNFAERARVAASLLPRYVEHYQNLRDLYCQGDDVDVAKLDAALSELDKTAVVEAEKVRTTDRKLVEAAEAVVMKEIGVT